MRGVDAACAAGLKVRMMSVLCSHTVDSIEYMANLARVRKATVQFLLFFNPTAHRRKADLQALALDNDRLRKALGRIRDLVRSGTPVAISPKALRRAMEWPDFSAPFSFRSGPGDRRFCRPAMTRCVIAYDGSVFPCCSSQGSFAALNWLDVGLDAALDNCRRGNSCVDCCFPDEIEHAVLYFDPAYLWWKVMGGL